MVASVRHLWKIACFGLVAPSLGCAVNLSARAAPTLDTTGRVGTEERADVAAALGSEDVRYSVFVGGGAGYLGAARSGYGLFTTGLGVEGGDAVQWGLYGGYTPRFLFDGGVAQGGGVTGELLFRVAEMGGESGGLRIGPHLSADGVANGGPELSGNRDGIGLFALGLTARWVTFDTTRKSFH